MSGHLSVILDRVLDLADDNALLRDEAANGREERLRDELEKVNEKAARLVGARDYWRAMFDEVIKSATSTAANRDEWKALADDRGELLTTAEAEIVKLKATIEKAKTAKKPAPKKAKAK